MTKQSNNYPLGNNQKPGAVPQRVIPLKSLEIGSKQKR